MKKDLRIIVEALEKEHPGLAIFLGFVKLVHDYKVKKEALPPNPLIEGYQGEIAMLLHHADITALERMKKDESQRQD